MLGFNCAKLSASSLMRDDSGTTSILFSVMFVFLLGGVAMAVDHSR